MSLSLTFLESFEIMREPFAILDGRLYTFTKEIGRNYVGIKGQYFFLSESEKIAVLERYFLEQNKGEIEKIINKELRRKGIRLNDDIFLGYRNNRVEKLVMLDVKHYLFGDGRKIDFNFPDNDDEILDISKLGKTGMTRLLEQKNILTMMNRCYELVLQKGKREKEEDGEKGRKVRKVRPGREKKDVGVCFAGEDYFLVKSSSLKKLAEAYKCSLEDKILQMIKNGNLNRRLKTITEQKKVLDKLKINNDLRIEKENGVYLALLKIHPFLIHNKGNYYYFEENELKIKLIPENDGVRILNKPDVCKRPYSHPFVYNHSSEMGICFGSFRWDHLVDFHRIYSFNDEKLPMIIGKMFRQALRVLTVGYNERANPITMIENYEPVADNRKDAEQFAEKKGIDFNMIYDN